MHTGLFWLRGARLDLIDLLPRGRDTPFAALAQTGENTWLLSYYSTHEVDTGNRGQSPTYLAKLSLE